MQRREGEAREGAERMADEHIRRSDVERLQERAEIADDAIDRAGHGSRFAPPQPRPIVGARPGEQGDLRLNTRPAQRRRRDAGLEDHRRRAGPGADRVKPVIPDGDEPARRRELPRGSGKTTLLIQDARCREDDDDQNDQDEQRQASTVVGVPGSSQRKRLVNPAASKAAAMSARDSEKCAHPSQ